MYFLKSNIQAFVVTFFLVSSAITQPLDHHKPNAAITLSSLIDERQESSVIVSHVVQHPHRIVTWSTNRPKDLVRRVLLPPVINGPVSAHRALNDVLKYGKNGAVALYTWELAGMTFADGKWKKYTGDAGDGLQLKKEKGQSQSKVIGSYGVITCLSICVLGNGAAINVHIPCSAVAVGIGIDVSKIGRERTENMVEGFQDLLKSMGKHFKSDLKIIVVKGFRQSRLLEDNMVDAGLAVSRFLENVWGREVAYSVLNAPEISTPDTIPAADREAYGLGLRQSLLYQIAREYRESLSEVLAPTSLGSFCHFKQEAISIDFEEER